MADAEPREIIYIELADGRKHWCDRYRPDERTVGHWEPTGITLEQHAPWRPPGQPCRVFYPWANVRAVEWAPPRPAPASP